jgi:hypothetical protein
MAITIKISTLAKELKMKSGKELIEKLAELGFGDIKSTSSTITPEAFNKLFESIRPSYTEDGIAVEDYLKGNAVIAEFKKKEEPKSAPAPKTEPSPKAAPAPKSAPQPKKVEETENFKIVVNEEAAPAAEAEVADQEEKKTGFFGRFFARK